MSSMQVHNGGLADICRDCVAAENPVRPAAHGAIGPTLVFWPTFLPGYDPFASVCE